MNRGHQRHPRRRPAGALRWLAVLSLFGLFSSLLATPSVQASSDAMSISLSPAKVSADVGKSVTLTATVKYVEDLDPVAGQRVYFTIKGVHTLKGGVASAVTDSAGKVTFTYAGIRDGTDTITTFLDLNNNGKFDTGEPADTAEVTWSYPTLLLTPESQTVRTGRDAQVRISLSGIFGPLVTFRYTVTGANPSSGTAVSQRDNPNPTINIGGTKPGVDTVTVYPDLNNNGVQDKDEMSSTVTIRRVANPTLTFSPVTQDAMVGSKATVKATLVDGYTPVPGVAIRFTSVGANGSGGSGTTDANGETSYSNTGTKTGTETVVAFADLNGNNQLDEGEPSATANAEIHWQDTPPLEPPTLPPAEVLQAASPATPQSGCMYFPETQHNVCSDTWGDAWSYWDTLGAAFLGYPITEPFQENGRTVQYTERARVELHFDLEPLAYDIGTGPAEQPNTVAGYEDASPTILFGLLGDEVTAGRSGEVPFQPTTANPSGDCTFYAETGHNLCGGFRAYWQKYGGLAINGFPISEDFQEVNPDTGKTYTVQYFERERYEWHPGEWPERFDVELGRLGAQVFSIKYGTAYH
jgi:hypothetical protein